MIVCPPGPADGIKFATQLVMVVNTTPEFSAPENPQKLLAPPPGSIPEPPKTEPHPPPPHSHFRRKIWLYAVVVLLALGTFFLLHSRSAARAASAKSAKGGRGGTAAVTPVVAVEAQTGNIGVYITGLGAITPLQTVEVKSRVDGQLMAVHFKEGDRVVKGDPLVDIDPRPYQAILDQTQGQLTRDEALLSNAIIDVDRYQTLLAQNAIPEQQLTTQRALVTQYQGTVAFDRGLVDAARLNVAYCHITAPITGVVGLRLVDPGNIVHAADTNAMTVIAQDQPISAIFTIAEDQLEPILKKIRAGDKLPVDAWDREQKNKLATGTLATVDNEIDQTTGTLKLRAIFDNKDRSLFPNQFVNARLLQQEKTGVTLLPSAAIQRNTNDTYVYFIKPDNTVTIRSIKVGTTEGDQSEIISGISPGDRVVMTGVDKLQEGTKVNPSLTGGK